MPPSPRRGGQELLQTLLGAGPGHHAAMAGRRPVYRMRRLTEAEAATMQRLLDSEGRKRRGVSREKERIGHLYAIRVLD